MKSATLPAEITSVEDKLAANLSLKQLVLMVIPVVATGLVYFVVPPVGKLALYKIAVSVFMLTIFIVLAVRVNNKLILEWIIVTGKYFLRPKLYVYMKGYSNPSDLNEDYTQIKEAGQPAEAQPVSTNIKLSDLTKAQSLIEDKRLQFAFKTSKNGGLHVSVFKA